MGSEHSKNTSLRGNSSYYGETGGFGEFDSENIQGTLRNLQLERLYQRAPHLRPKKRSNTDLKFKTVISVTDTMVKQIDNALVIVLSMKSETPGRISVIGNGMINSISFAPSNGVQISIPIPKKESFTIEILPDLSVSPILLKEGYQLITKHVFKYLFDGNTYSLVEQYVFVGKQHFEIEASRKITPEQTENQNLCMFCLTLPASVAISECGHKIVCDFCLEQLGAHCHHCPICNSPTTF